MGPKLGWIFWLLEEDPAEKLPLVVGSRCDVDCGFLIWRVVYCEVTKGSTFARPLGVVCAGWVFEGCRREKLCVGGFVIAKGSKLDG